MSKVILVVGATGQQGRATINALSALPPQNPPIQVLALTRSSASPKAQQLKQAFPNITLIEGDVKSPFTIFGPHQNITSIILVTVPPYDEAQARPMIDAAIKHGVSHVVFSSVDRGGEEKSWENLTEIPHFAAKCRLEWYLRQRCNDNKTTWTILRPAGFMDNYNPGFFGKMMAGLWATMPEETRMQLVSVQDIGNLAAKALMDPEKWAGRAVGIAGDELTFGEANAAFKKVVGYDMPKTWDVMSRGIRWGIEDAGKSMEWFEKEGFGVDIEGLRKEGIEIQSFEGWLRDNSEWCAKDWA